MVWIGGARMHGAKNGAWTWDDQAMRVNFTNWEEEGEVDGPEEEDKDNEGPGGGNLTMPVIFIWRKRASKVVSLWRFSF